jgi:hypothetical protein
MACTACVNNTFNSGFSPMGFAPQAPQLGAFPAQSAGAFAAPNTFAGPGMDNSMVGPTNMMLAAMTEMLFLLMSMMGAGNALANPLADAYGGPQASGGPSGVASGSSSSGGSAPANSASEVSGPVSGSANGKKLAQAAEGTAKRMNSTGWCYKGVSESLRSIGVTATGASAYMAADQLAKNPKMKEIQVSAKDLTKLPAGAVVVWNKSGAHPHGHISVALGNGKEASDHIQNQMTNYGTSHRVFVPV